MAKRPTDLIYLASQSPRRQQLLEQWGVATQKLLPDADEDTEALEAARGSEAPATYVQRVTRLKLQAALARVQRQGLPSRPVLCADTTVALGREILGKPESKRHAREMLTALAGRSHQVLTAVAVGQGAQQALLLSRSRVTFAPLSATQIARYMATGEPMGKAGAYGIQGLAGLWVSEIRGSYTAIMGLPAFETAQLLRQFGLRLAV
jgi:septum formation protein